MSTLQRFLVLAVLALALCLPGFARVDGGETGGGGGGGITILPCAPAEPGVPIASTSVTDYRSSGIRVRMPLLVGPCTAVIMIPGTDVPAAVLAGSSCFMLTGEELTQLYEGGVREFAIKIVSVTDRSYTIEFDLASADRVNITVF